MVVTVLAAFMEDFMGFMDFMEVFTMGSMAVWED
jgi:hypothetical protein